MSVPQSLALFQRVVDAQASELRALLAQAQTGSDGAPWLIADERDDGRFALRHCTGALQALFALLGVSVPCTEKALLTVLPLHSDGVVFAITADTRGEIICVERVSGVKP